MNFFNGPLKISDLNKTEISFLRDPDRTQGLRYSLKKRERINHAHSSNQLQETDMIFHHIYKNVDQLTQDSFHDAPALREIRAFTNKLQWAESEGREYFESEKGDDWSFRMKTTACRFFGSTPLFGSHEQRILDLQTSIDKRISELEKTKIPGRTPPLKTAPPNSAYYETMSYLK